MPSARANISAKFIAQIETGAIRVARKRTPAEAISPTIVSIRGRPAATSEPKASNMIARVTGQESSSERSIASLLASLKSDHMPAAPVRLVSTPAAALSPSGPLRSPAAATIASGSRAAPARITAVCPSAEIEIPGRGGITRLTAGSAASKRSARRTLRRKPGSATVSRDEWTATWRA